MTLSIGRVYGRREPGPFVRSARARRRDGSLSYRVKRIDPMTNNFGTFIRELFRMLCGALC
jgi:hypothetical protein